MTVLSQETWRPVELYGGAIIAQFPERFVDVSDFRPVPDHQEVRGHCTDAGGSAAREHCAAAANL